MKVTVIDSPMGKGKTEWAIKYMQNKENYQRFLYITPYLDEVDRVMKSMSIMHTPLTKFAKGGTKFNHLKDMTEKGYSLATTHSLFSKVNEEVKQNLKTGWYVLILDEVLEISTEFKFNTKSDKKDFFDFYAYIGEDNYIYWDEEKHPSDKYEEGSKFYDAMLLCKNKSLVNINGKLVMWEFPPSILEIFEEVYILTYKFNGSIMKPYLESNNIEFEYKSVENGQLVEHKDLTRQEKEHIKSLINITDSPKLNALGDNKFAFSATWMRKYIKKDSTYLKEVKNNIYNFFFNIAGSKSDEAMWSTYKEFKGYLQGKGYTKGYVAFNVRATNNYRHKKNLAYVLNVFPHTSLTMYIQDKGLSIDEDEFALQMLIQWIWRSRIRDYNKPDEDRKINLYLPSSRMRELLLAWLDS
jgi:hypothetical protein